MILPRVSTGQPARERHACDKESLMPEIVESVKLGQMVPDFELTTYEPSKGDFGKFSLAQQKQNKRWTILFFYPADFTFV
jgi:hypothetical protein